MDDTEATGMRMRLQPGQLFDGTELAAGRDVLVEEGRICAVLDRAEPDPAGATGRDWQRQVVPGTLAPGFLDIQVNGGGGALVNTLQDAAEFQTILDAHAKGGTAHMLPTVITDAPEVLAHVVTLFLQAWPHPALAGLHIEGPHISLARRGTHATQHIRPLDQATWQAVGQLRAAGVPVLMTVAPETVSPDEISALVGQGVHVSLGHTDATAAVMAQGFAAGAGLVTHLFNGMSQMQNREAGAVGAAIDSDAYCSIIADGIHVSDQMLAIACRARPVAERMVLITDAMPTVNGPDAFDLYGKTVRVEAGRLVNAEGSLAGAHVTMAGCVRFMVEKVGLVLAPVLAMATSVPATALGLEGQLGHIAPGRTARFTVMSDDLSEGHAFCLDTALPGN